MKEEARREKFYLSVGWSSPPFDSLLFSFSSPDLAGEDKAMAVTVP
jgi:hypothetical protein